MAQAKENIRRAARLYPLHGLLICLRHVIDEMHVSDLLIFHKEWKHVFHDILDAVKSLSDDCMSVLMDTTYETHMDENDECQDEDAFEAEAEEEEFHDEQNDFHDEEDTRIRVEAEKTKEGGLLMESQHGVSQMQFLLSYCWRAMKEAGLLVGAVMLKCPLTGINPMFSTEEFQLTGQWLVTTLLALKHWGAVSAISETLISLCKVLLLSSSEQTLAQLPFHWLSSVLTSIRCRRHDIAMTRRSAGLPFCVVALLVSEMESSNHPGLVLAMTELLAMAREPLPMDPLLHENLSQVRGRERERER